MTRALETVEQNETIDTVKEPEIVQEDLRPWSDPTTGTVVMARTITEAREKIKKLLNQER